MEIAIIPGLSEPPDKGPFVELAKALAETYTQGKITIELFPFTRSIDNVVAGRADFHIPNVRNPAVDSSKLPYRYSTKSLGRVDFVVYSGTGKVITGQMLAMPDRDVPDALGCDCAVVTYGATNAFDQPEAWHPYDFEGRLPAHLPGQRRLG